MTTGSSVATVDAYGTSLTRIIAQSLSDKNSQLAATTVSDYAIFGGGVENVVDIFNVT